MNNIDKNKEELIAELRAAQTRIKQLESEQSSQSSTHSLELQTYEFRSPLNTIVTMTRLLLETNLDLEQQDYVETIRISGEMLVAVMNKLFEPGTIGNIEPIIAASSPEIDDHHALQNKVPVIDLTKLRLLLSEYEREMFVEFIDLFLAEVPKQLTELDIAIQKNDARHVRRIVHSLKSTSATFGAMRLSSLCEQFEVESRVGLGEFSVEQLSQIQNAYQEVETALTELVQ
ncbi:Hpt domain-containing protein [Anaerolineales bacterium HSG6]|nr:Hpt domain-containing protein [Anaerolineales bacterium HSG6]MDM8529747.1 Hpt domain-containing protein [Anaerolineales bacterium HSG25]